MKDLPTINFPFIMKSTRPSPRSKEISEKIKNTNNNNFEINDQTYQKWHSNNPVDMKENVQKIESITNSNDMRILSQFSESFVVPVTLFSNSNESDLSKRVKRLNKRARKRKKSTNKKNAIDNDNDDDIEHSTPS